MGLFAQGVRAQDTTKYTVFKDLPLKPQRKIGSWPIS
jgi:hypothetical protein